MLSTHVPLATSPTVLLPNPIRFEENFMINKYLHWTRPISDDTTVVARGIRLRRIESIILAFLALAVIGVATAATEDPCAGGLVYAEDGVYQENTCTGVVELAIPYGDA